MKNIVTITTILLILLAIIGQIVRDRTVEFALLMYIPLIPLGLWAILWDVLQIGRSLPNLRFGVTMMGLAILTWGSLSMISIGSPQIHKEAKAQISVLHWNVYWGGRNGSWPLIRHEIKQRNPDIAIINEPPSKNRLNQLLNTMGWTSILYTETRRNPLAVCSSWPLKFERSLKIKDADAMTIIVTVQGYPLRILAIDGERNMSKKLTILARPILPRWRMPMLSDIVNTLKTHHATGNPIDIIAGDFNAISRSIGFDKFAEVAGGYHLASKFANGWRGTWKSYLPLFDLDHIWIHQRFQGLQTELFTHPGSDHRGQWVQFQISD